MLKRLFLTCILTLAMASSAFAAGSGVYAGVKLLDSYQSQWANGSIGGYESSNTLGLGVFVGYDFYYNSDLPIRTELEYAFRSDWNGSSSDNLGGQYTAMDMKNNVQTLMANIFYDFHNDSMFTPYVGVGLGLGLVDTELNFVSGNDAAYRESFNSVLAWNVGLGVSAALTESVSADLGYRYLGLGTSETDVLGYKYESTGSAHEFSLGMRVNF